jgi:hypothetical protein
MQPHNWRTSAWGAFAFIALVYLGAWVLWALNRPVLQDMSSSNAAFMGATFSFPLVGVLVASKRPRNPIAWLLLAIGLAWGLGALVDGYAVYATRRDPGALLRADLVLALTSWWWVAGVGLLGTFLPLLFPDGRLPSTRWRPWGRFCALTLILSSLITIVRPGPFSAVGFPELTNPLGLSAMRPLLDAAAAVSLLVLVVCMLGCVVALIQRFRRAHGQERLQLKWLTASIAIAGAAYAFVISLAGFLELTGRPEPNWFGVLANLMFFSFILIPAAVGIAVLRYRLYDIDLIINRALVYGALTAMLAMVYAGSVFGAGALLRAGTSQETNSVAVAASTLAVAALFRPLRGRLQSFIDRHFYRRKYDAAQTVHAFSARLRQEIDLENLTSELVTVAQQTMQPVSVWVWLRPARGNDG